jgi:hypothetical protein
LFGAPSREFLGRPLTLLHFAPPFLKRVLRLRHSAFLGVTGPVVEAIPLAAARLTAFLPSATGHLTAPHSPAAFAFVATEHEDLVRAFLRLFGVIDVGKNLLDDGSRCGSSLRHSDVTAL